MIAMVIPSTLSNVYPGLLVIFRIADFKMLVIIGKIIRFHTIYANNQDRRVNEMLMVVLFSYEANTSQIKILGKPILSFS